MSKKKKIIIVVVVLLVIGAIGNLFEKDDDESQKATEATENVQESETIVPETDASDPEKKETDPETQAIETEKPESEPEAVSDNPLMAAELQVGDVMNGTRTEKLGEYAYIRVSLETMKNITMEQYAEFCSQVVKDSGYNWITIDFGNGNGIQFQGSIPSIASYGSLDAEGCIVESIGTIMLTGDDTYEYTEN